MAFMYPQDDIFTNQGEEALHAALRDFLPDGYICYHNRKVGLLEFDFAVLAPGCGIVVIEVKGHRAGDIKSVRDNTIQLASGESLYSPYEQANKYRFMFASIVKQKIGREIPIFAMAAYPFITEDEYKKKELHLLSSRQSTLLAEDLNASLPEKIEKLVDQGRKETQKQFSELTLNITEQIRLMFEPKENVAGYHLPAGEHRGIRKRTRYSVLASIAIDNVPAEPPPQLVNYLEEWKSGTKIILFIRSAVVQDYILSLFQQHIKTLDIVSYERFTLYKPNEDPQTYTFNLETYILPNAPQKLEIIDGSLSETDLAFLNQAGQDTDFNTEQYLLEHAITDTDIMVTAGAGTGKTTCMISRVSYLIYKHALTADTLPDTLFMLTFTAEAASNMKLRLQSYFQNYFLLTMDYESLRLAECIENMRISTIHALAKRILEHYAAKLGLGKNVAIVSGKFEKDTILSETLDRYIVDQGLTEAAGNLFNMPLYELQSRLADIMAKLQNKNVDIVNDPLNFGTSGTAHLHSIVTDVTIAAEVAIREHFNKLGAVRLSDLMIKLKELVSVHGRELSGEGFPIRYLFVDEFQDTDDVQINLMKHFRNVFGFHFFVVGDVKQCIYRFRGADEKAFDTLAPNKNGWLRFSLNKNYRTDKKLLVTFDKHFAAWGTHGLLEYNETDVLVGVKDLDNTDMETSYYYGDTNWRTKADKEKRFIRLLRRLLKDINDKPDEQIAVLVRENWQAEDIKRICKENGIFVDTDAGGDLYQLQPAIDLYKLIKALQHYKDPKYLFNLYSTYYVEQPMPKGHIFVQRQFTEGLLGLFNTKLTPIANWSGYVESLKYEPVLKVLRELVIATKPWENYASKEPFPEYSTKMEIFYHHNLDEIFEKLAFEFNSDYLTISKVEKFLEIMILTKQQEQRRESMVDESRAKVICSTVHKAKGLEYYAVMLPYMTTAIGSTIHKGQTDVIVMDNDVGYSIKDSDGKQINNSIYQQYKEHEARFRRYEEARILYVAMTRAKKRLVYFDDGGNAGNLEEPKNWAALLRKTPEP